MGLYERQRTGKIAFLCLTATAILIFLFFANTIVKQLAEEERERMNIWAQATQRLANADGNTDFEFLLSIITQNNTIPVMVADSTFAILDSRNFRLPDEGEPGSGVAPMTERNAEYLQKRLRKACGSHSLAEMAANDPHFIIVEAFDASPQYIYYEDSILLRRLSYYPYISMGAMILIAAILYFAVAYTKRAEQNRVWVGLSKETAHQLGTPISSLMAWTEYLESTGTDPDITAELDKDVKRLSVIADRFSKIGSVPELQLEYLNESVAGSLDYMKSRISGKINVEMRLSEDEHGVMLSRRLFEWVMENLTKNAVDAMEGAGRLTITTGRTGSTLWIELADTGKGIARKNFKTIFNPGYTTKKRGWGLGLTLVKRIIEEYHDGKIYVKESEPGRGTTFRIELPAV